ncbi:hypothetical protein K466DRAFT_493282 [Polyporus arcularius HHB13444]|uniref:Uncharacterized protein n=1 Tax=Polyporus arcularius HHB13444 TaxID=1314778 RepID=A0A5C3P945_9APHY|nr:hypothetical protein K466DRAFT_493282 [Polyporus arcularius HHB13444]
MIAVQKPPSMFSPPAFRTAHARHPSGPVVVRPSHTPGVLNLAKPVQSAPRPQPTHVQPRAPRASPKGKPQQRTPQPAPAQAAVVEKTKAPSSAPAKAEQPSTSPEKSPRGRKQHKQSKDAGRRTSVSPSDVVSRRHAHQPSPARIPSPQKATPAPRAQVSRVKPEDTTSSTDPFTDAITAPKTSGKSFLSSPKLATEPSGKLARRRQVTAQLLDSPTPKVGSRRKPAKAHNGEAAIPFNVATRPLPRRASTDMTIRWDSFPVCDDSSEFGGDDSDITPPTTPIRESVPSKAAAAATWQQESLFFDNAPRSAPLSSTVGFSSAPAAPSTPTPAQRRRNHRRVPSDGMFAMSSDEGSPSSSVVDLNEQARRHTPVAIPRQRCYTSPAGTPSYEIAPSQPFASASAPSAVYGYFAGSVFQSSPSPDALPVPSFAL